TIAVVAVVPHGVVQLGSLHSVTEDMKLVTHIKDVFCSLQNSSTKIFPYPLPDTTQNSSYLSEVSAKISGADVLNDYLLSSDNITLSNRKIDVQSYSSSSPKKFHGLPQDVLALHNQKKTVEMVGDVAQMSTSMRDHDNIDFLQTKSVIFNSQQHKQAHRELNKKVKCEEGMGGWRNMVVQSRDSGVSVAYNYSCKSPNSDKSMLPHDNSVNFPFLPSSILCSDVGVDSKFDRGGCLRDEEVPSMKPFEMQMTESEVSCTDTVNNSLRFSAGCELYEALGPAFSVQQDKSSWSESERTEAEKIMPLEGMVSSLFTTECGSDYLLEAVVIKSSTLSSNSKSENAFSKSAESVLTTGKTSETSNYIKHSNMIASGSGCHSAPWVENAHEKVKMIWDSTKVCNLRLSKELSSKTMSTSSKQSEIQIEQAKVNRKRARPGESCRPRPRDRQLIQDRVKELRELVPNGSKVIFLDYLCY
ncbi:Transcription factor protein, partial [Thalictrum thalictroides]